MDIKTTKFLSFTQEQYNQLIGYYILSKLGKINESEDIPISKIGIYFSRHGILHTISAEEIENHPNFHAVQFVVDIVTSYYKSVRGKETKLPMSDQIRDMITNFSEDIEAVIDEEVKDD
ncbi:MAG: hypothetical protein IIB46_07020 [Nitrospinae bacterium]|nr:hypothetical protein [Nitrospinota bacterium]